MNQAEESRDARFPAHGHPGRDPQTSQDPGRVLREQLSQEDILFLKKMRMEAALTRGYPIAFITAGLTVIGIGRFYPQVRRLHKWAIAGTVGVLGNMIGKATYAPTIIQKAQTELPPESFLRRLAETRKNGGNMMSVFNQVSAPKDEEMQFGLEEDSRGEALEEKKFVSYQELRQQNRQMERSKLDSKFSRQHPLPKYPSTEDAESSVGSLERSPEPDHSTTDYNAPPPPAGKVRYNKYGDQIIE